MPASLKTLIEAGADAGPLSTPMKRLRLRILKSVKDVSLEDAFALLRGRLAQEPDANTRLGSLAAQTWLIRQRLLTNNGGTVIVANQIEQLEPAKVKPIETLPAAVAPDSTPNETEMPWQKVKILEETVVNGMRFFKDSVIEVNSDDAEKLISSQKAVGFDDVTEVVEQKKPTRKRKSKPKATPTDEAKQ